MISRSCKFEVGHLYEIEKGRHYIQFNAIELPNGRKFIIQVLGVLRIRFKISMD